MRNAALLARGSNTVEAVAKRFIDQDAKPNIESWSKIERALELHVYPEWGERNIGDIRRRDVHELLVGLIARGKIGTATDVRKHLSRLFNWAIDREIFTGNSLSGLKRKDLQYKADAGRALTDDEVRAIWRAADGRNFDGLSRIRMRSSSLLANAIGKVFAAGDKRESASVICSFDKRIAFGAASVRFSASRCRAVGVKMYPVSSMIASPVRKPDAERTSMPASRSVFTASNVPNPMRMTRSSKSRQTVINSGPIFRASTAS